MENAANSRRQSAFHKKRSFSIPENESQQESSKKELKKSTAKTTSDSHCRNETKKATLAAQQFVRSPSPNEETSIESQSFHDSSKSSLGKTEQRDPVESSTTLREDTRSTTPMDQERLVPRTASASPSASNKAAFVTTMSKPSLTTTTSTASQNESSMDRKPFEEFGGTNLLPGSLIPFTPHPYHPSFTRPRSNMDPLSIGGIDDSLLRCVDFSRRAQAIDVARAQAESTQAVSTLLSMTPLVAAAVSHRPEQTANDSLSFPNFNGPVSLEILANMSSVVEQHPSLFFDVPLSCSPCKCKTTQCLKLYCACFREGSLCNQKLCKCKGCLNTAGESGPTGSRAEAIALIVRRQPDAFGKRPSKQSGNGCACKKSRCLKKYCDCFSIGVKCGPKCSCTDCSNGSSDPPSESNQNVAAV